MDYMGSHALQMEELELQVLRATNINHLGQTFTME